MENGKAPVRGPEKQGDANIPSGGLDMAFLEGQARKIVDQFTKSYYLTWAFCMVVLIVVQVSLFFILRSTTALAILAFYLVYFTFVMHPKLRIFKGKPDQDIVGNLFQWRDYFERSGKGPIPDPRARLETSMRIVGSIEQWILTLNQRKERMLPAMFIFAAGGAVMILMLSWPTPMGLLYLVVGVIVAIGILIVAIWSVIKRRNRKELEFWRPRLEIYRKRLDGYWGPS